MTIDRDIIFDLIPLCQSGLASEPSRRLVETWLRDHPEVQAGGSAGPVTAGDDIALFARARSLRRRLRWLHSLAIGFTILCFSSEFHFDGGRLTSAQLLVLDHPLLFVPVILAAIGCWTGYFMLKGRLA
jgi:hypothetical protein